MTRIPEPCLCPRKQEANRQIAAILAALEEEVPEEAEFLWSVLGGVLGACLALTLIFLFGKVSGLSAPGITSGLAATGALFGGGMLTGLCLFLLPPPLLGIAGYSLARRKNRMQLVRAAQNAADALDALRSTLAMEPHFSEELRALDWLIICVRQTPVL